MLFLHGITRNYYYIFAVFHCGFCFKHVFAPVKTHEACQKTFCGAQVSNAHCKSHIDVAMGDRVLLKLEPVQHFFFGCIYLYLIVKCLCRCTQQIRKRSRVVNIKMSSQVLFFCALIVLPCVSTAKDQNCQLALCSGRDLYTCPGWQLPDNDCRSQATLDLANKFLTGPVPGNFYVLFGTQLTGSAEMNISPVRLKKVNMQNNALTGSVAALFNCKTIEEMWVTIFCICMYSLNVYLW